MKNMLKKSTVQLSASGFAHVHIITNRVHDDLPQNDVPMYITTIYIYM